MRVLVTRPRRDAETTAQRLRDRGHEPVVAPVMEIIAVERGLPSGPFDAVLATSAQAIEALTDADVARLRELPLHVVGLRTAAAASRRGFARVGAPAPDGTTLAGNLREAGYSFRNVLYLAGRDRKPDLETALAAMRTRIEVAVVYEAREVAALPAEAARELANGQLDAVLHFSRRSAALLAELATRAGAGDALKRLRHVCISADAAQLLIPLGYPTIVAATPDQAGLFAALETM